MKLLLTVPDKITKRVSLVPLNRAAKAVDSELEVNEENVKLVLSPRTDYHVDYFFAGPVTVEIVDE